MLVPTLARLTGIQQFLLAAGLAYEKSSRATNMVYSQMLFALGFDKLIFGHTPGVMSILGSSLILGSAIVVAVQKDPQRQPKENVGGAVDEESRTGLLRSGTSSDDFTSDQDRLSTEDVPLQSLR